jgi:hypothetical protein
MQLTVPHSLAGVTGPCPNCQVLIQAPDLAPVAAYQAPVLPPQQEVHARSPQPGYGSEARPAAPLSSILYPESRQLPTRSDPAQEPTRVKFDPSGDKPPLGQSPPIKHRPHKTRIARALVPLTFLCVAIGVIYGVKTFLQKAPSENLAKQSQSAENGRSPAAVKVILPPQNETFESLTQGKGVQTIAAEDPPLGMMEEGFPPELQPVDGGIEALELLEKFLAMETLEQRLPYLETKRSEADLASSPLNGKLPEILRITVDIRETNSIEQVIDYFYHVDFADEAGGANPQTMLVRSRGTSPPKVVVDPFLDLYGGRFARYAETPVEDAGTFQVIISAGAFCYDDVPGAEKKFTLKILSREDSKEIAKAYFGKRSKIGDMLEDETSGLSWAQAKACTVFMRWNTDEDPERPFLEALDIKALNWNP